MLQIPNEKLKEFLVGRGTVTAEDFDLAIKEAERQGQALSNILITRNLITPDVFNKLLADYFGVELADLAKRKIDEESLRLLPEELARQKRAIVFGREADGSLNIAIEDPSDLPTIEFLSRYLNSQLRLFLASSEDLNRGFVYYGRKLAYDFKKIIEENIQETLKSKAYGKEEKEAALELPIVSIVDNLLSYAMASRASDIHIEILDEEILVRFRIDGVLHEIVRIPKEVHASITARIKLLSGLKLDEHGKPQDGRFRYKMSGDLMDVRVAVMPTYYGEKVEMRLLSAAQRAPSLDELGFLADHKEIILRNIKKTYGMVLVCGPTGAGKTTTLYALINILNRPEVNIATIEDPIEYDIKYINQTQINSQAGVNFAEGLRALLRQDPNIILVGEIRDGETADVSVQAALTGHLVISSLHTNDAPTAVPRLVDMKIPPFLVAAVLNAISSQRLVRKLCQDCKREYKPDEVIVGNIREKFKEIGLNEIKFKPPRVFYGPQGCNSCNHSGYKGRLGIFEVIDVTDDVRRAIVRPDFTLDYLKEVIRKQGAITMFEDGLRKVEGGLTSLEEVLRVLGE